MYAVYDCNDEWVRGGYETVRAAVLSLTDEERENGSYVDCDDGNHEEHGGEG